MTARGPLGKLAGLGLAVKAALAAAVVLAFAGAAGTATLVSSHQPDEARQGLDTAQEAQDNGDSTGQDGQPHDEAPPESPGQHGLDRANETPAFGSVPESTTANPGDGPADAAADQAHENARNGADNAENGADNAENGDENAENGADNAENGDQGPPESPGQQGLNQANQTPAQGNAPESTPANPGQPSDAAADEARGDEAVDNGDRGEEVDSQRGEEGQAFGQSQADAGGGPGANAGSGRGQGR